jgi:membrane-anchored protein YejM (alkaline phosphatase superfamily)
MYVHKKLILVRREIMGCRGLLHAPAALPQIEQETGWGLATLWRREESFAHAGKRTTHDWFVVLLPTYVAVSIALYNICIYIYSTAAITQLLFLDSHFQSYTLHFKNVNIYFNSLYLVVVCT